MKEQLKDLIFKSPLSEPTQAEFLRLTRNLTEPQTQTVIDYFKKYSEKHGNIKRMSPPRFHATFGALKKVLKFLNN